MVDRVGTDIAGYRIESLIARGGMGEVYLATQDFPERKVALKLLPHDLASDPAFRERFIRESNAAASLEHPNIVPVYGAGESDGELWIAMRYVDGQDLRSLLKREGPLAPERAASICAQVADALEVAHEHGLVHRDVKPGNILVTKGDRAYLSDFGLIRPIELNTSLTKTGQLMGTVEYVAPEQIRGEAVDGRADIYSLGCVLYECLTGEPPVRRETEVATLYAHLEDPPPMPSATVPVVPTALDEIVAKAMAKRPDERYPTADELEVAIRAGVGPQTVATESLRDRKRRRAWAIGGFAIVVAALGIAIILSSGGSGDDSTAADQTGPSTVPALNSAIEVDSDSGDIVARSPNVGRGGDRNPTVVVGEGSVWILAPASGQGANQNLYRIDPDTLDVERTIPAGAPPPATFDVGSRTVWFARSPACVPGNCGDILRFNPLTGEELRPISFEGQIQLQALSVGKNAVWAGFSDGDLARIDGPSGRIEDKFPSEVSGIDAIAATGGAVWIADRIDGLVLRVDSKTDRVTDQIPVAGNLDAIDADESGAWVLDRFSGTVTPIDAETNDPGQPIRVGGDASDIAVGAGSVWVTDQTENVIYRIDPELHSVVDKYDIGAPLAAVAVDENADVLWVVVASTPTGG